jgi:hypothetical protein
MLMVIFGAGASYDSFSSALPGEFGTIGGRQSYPERPPLANELFQDFPLFRDQLLKYPQCRPLIPRLEGASDIEGILGSWQNDADDQRKRQLAAIRYYLRDLIFECQRQWNHRTRGVSNYGAVLDQIRVWPRVSLVKFNYDTLIEQGLADLGVRIQSMGDYLADHKFQLFKLHGSIDWTQKAVFNGTYEPDLRWSSAREIIQHAPSLEMTGNLEMHGAGALPTQLQGRNIVHDVFFVPLVPALAIPATTKSTFICPKRHL